MPFGPVNGPVIFIVFIHDLDSTWKALAVKRGLLIDDSLNTKIIVDNIFSWAKTFDAFIQYFTCQLDICITQNLSLSLKKSFFCPDRMEFVGHDVCSNGNRPAMSKHLLMTHWPAFVTARDVSSFVGFINFYSAYIPCFEQRIKLLRDLTKFDITHNIQSLLTPAHHAAKRDMIDAICSDPCIARFDYSKRSYLLTDFSSLGFGYDLCQPDGNDPASMAAMQLEIAGGECQFLLPKSTLKLRSTGFGSRTTRGRENMLHSHLGEGFALDWAIHKNRHKLWGTRFTSITDCYALRFILSYDGPNAVLLRLQMRIQLWALDLYHRPADRLITPDYLSRFGASLCYDELSRTYLNKTVNFRENYPAASGTLLPENMPGYRAPRIRSSLPAQSALFPVSTAFIDPALAPILTAINCNASGGHHFCLQTIPILTGHISDNDSKSMQDSWLHQPNISLLASELMEFSLAVYGFNSGHFLPLHHNAALTTLLPTACICKKIISKSRNLKIKIHSHSAKNL